MVLIAPKYQAIIIINIIIRSLYISLLYYYRISPYIVAGIFSDLLETSGA